MYSSDDGCMYSSNDVGDRQSFFVWPREEEALNQEHVSRALAGECGVHWMVEWQTETPF